MQNTQELNETTLGELGNLDKYISALDGSELEESAEVRAALIETKQKIQTYMQNTCPDFFASWKAIKDWALLLGSKSTFSIESFPAAAAKDQFRLYGLWGKTSSHHCHAILLCCSCRLYTYILVRNSDLANVSASASSRFEGVRRTSRVLSEK